MIAYEIGHQYCMPKLVGYLLRTKTSPRIAQWFLFDVVWTTRHFRFQKWWQLGPDLNMSGSLPTILSINEAPAFYPSWRNSLVSKCRLLVGPMPFCSAWIHKGRLNLKDVTQYFSSDIPTCGFVVAIVFSMVSETNT